MVSLEELLEADEEGEEVDKDKKKDKPTTGEGVLKHIWNAESPKKSPSQYVEHALNWDQKESTGRIIKGIEGLVGNMDKAIVNLVIGVFQKISEFIKREDATTR